VAGQPQGNALHSRLTIAGKIRVGGSDGYRLLPAVLPPSPEVLPALEPLELAPGALTGPLVP
jgi:hypothetical protein